MKKIKILFLPLIAVLFFAGNADAQKGDLRLDLKYNYSLPVSGFNKDLISNISPRGFEGAIMYQFNDRWSGGLDIAYQDYYQKYPRGIYAQSKTQTVSAVITNSIQTTPVMLKGQWVPVENTARIKPYISLGAGANLVNFDQYLGQFASGGTSVNFIGQAGLGVNIPFDKAGNYAFTIGSNYNYAPYKKYGYKDLSSVNFQAGFSIKMK